MLCLEAAKTEARKMTLADMARIALAVLLGCTLCIFGRLAVEMISANKRERERWPYRPGYLRGAASRHSVGC